MSTALLWAPMRRWLLSAGAAALICGPTVMAFFSGGFFDRPRLIAALVVWVIVIMVAVTAASPVPAGTPARVALGALFLLALWTTASVAWAPLGGRAVDDVQRLVLYLGFFACALALLRGPGVRRWVEPMMALGSLVAVGFALSERLLPELVDLDRSLSAAGRLEQPLSYWNALGIFAAMGLLLTIRIAGDLDRGRGLRAAAAAAGVPLGLGVYLTFARGALASVAVGIVVLLAYAPAARPQLRGMVAIVAGSVVAALVASRFPTVTSLDPREQADPGDGALMLTTIVLLALGAAAIVAYGPRRQISLPKLPFSRPTAVLAATSLAMLGAVVVIAVFEGAPEGSSPARGADPARLGSIDTNRYRYWDVALETWADHPLIGIGSGGFLVDWLKERDRVDTSGDAHSLYLETLGELGIVGFAFLIAFLSAVVAGVVRLHRVAPGLATGPAAVLAAFAVHAGLDWDWEMPAVSLFALLFAAAPLAWSEDRSTGADARIETGAPRLNRRAYAHGSATNL
jgi:O-antigen ligase